MANKLGVADDAAATAAAAVIPGTAARTRPESAARTAGTGATRHLFQLRFRNLTLAAFIVAHDVCLSAAFRSVSWLTRSFYRASLTSVKA
jgi:hypothetical protein